MEKLVEEEASIQTADRGREVVARPGSGCMGYAVSFAEAGVV